MGNFSFGEFRNWISQNGNLSEFFDINKDEQEPAKPSGKFIGKEVLAKVSPKKIHETIKTESGNADELVEDLLEFGGTIVDTKGKDLLLEVTSGTFYIPRFCVKLKKSEDD
jgi:hypothetical protein